MAPIVVVIASVATFSAHMLLGFDLTAAQVWHTQSTPVSCCCCSYCSCVYDVDFTLTDVSSPCLQAFTVVTVFNAMTFALKVTPFSVKSLSEASVAVERFKVWHTSFIFLSFVFFYALPFLSVWDNY